MTARTGLKRTDESQRPLDRARAIVASDERDDPPRSDVMDAALTHLIGSQENLEDVRDRKPAATVKDWCKTGVIGLRSRTVIESSLR
jgi:hypothetical protein